MSRLRVMLLISFLMVECFMTSITGCKYQTPKKPDDFRNIMLVGKYGTPKNTITNKVYPLTNKPEVENYQQYLKELVKSDGKLLIYIHGGLNEVNDANKRAKTLGEEMENTGYNPIFINWDSDLFSTYGQHLVSDRQGELWKSGRGGITTSAFIFLEDVGRGLIKTPMVWVYQTKDFFRLFSPTYPEVNAAKKNNLELLEDKVEPFGSVPKVVDSEGNLLDQRRGKNFLVGLGGKAEDLGGGVFRLCNGWWTAPLFAAIGTGCWYDMNRRANITIDKNQFYLENPIIDGFDRRYGPGYHLFEEIKKQQEEHPTRKIVIVLIGHSMGTIIASKVLALWPEINYERIIFMAAACTIDDFRAAVVPHLKKCKNTKFYNYMLHPKAENIEWHYAGFGGTGSLLNQIDNIYANPNSESCRTLGKWINVMNGRRFFEIEGVKNQIHLVTMPFSERWPREHGEFDNLYFDTKKPKNCQHIWHFWLDEEEPEESDFNFEKITGVVEKMNTKEGTITVNVCDKEVTLNADGKMFEGINEKEKVEIGKEGKVLKCIKKVKVYSIPVAPAVPGPPPQTTPNTTVPPVQQ